MSLISCPMRGIVAPSKNLLGFLRRQVDCAFEPGAISRCAGQRSAGTSARGGKLDGGVRGRGIGANGCGIGAGKAASRSYASLRALNPRTKSQSAILDRGSNYPALSSCLFVSPFNRHQAFSTASLHNAWNLFSGKKPQSPPPLRRRISPLSGVMDEGGSLNTLGRHMRSANELKMRCTELDENGEVTMVSGEFKKTELIAKVCPFTQPKQAFYSAQRKRKLEC